MSKSIQLQLTKPQFKFYNSKSKFLLFSSGIGCLHESTLLDTPDGKKPIADCSGEYRSFDGLKITSSLGSAPFPKGKGDLYRVVTEQGEFVSHGSHLVLSSSCEYVPSLGLNVGDDLFSCASVSQDHFLTNLELSLLELRQDVRRSMKIVEDFLDHYLIYCRRYGLQLHSGLDNAQGIFLSIVDVLAFYLNDAHKGVPLELEQEHTRPYQSTDHQAKPDSFLLAEDLTLILVDFLEASFVEHTLQNSQQYQQSQKTRGHRHKDFLFYLCRTLVFSLSRPCAINKVLAKDYHSKDWYWDIQIPNHHNYTACGSVHHNSGKSYIGAHWAKNKLAEDPYSKGLICANTYNQLRNATLTTFFSVLDEFNIPYSYNQQRNIIDVAGRTVYAYSLDNYDNLRGIEVGWFWLDEVRDTKEQAFKVVMGRLRDRRAKRLEGRLTSSPSGFNWLYDYFVGSKKTDQFEIIQGSSHENPFLPEGYIDSLKGSYDEKTYQQEVLGDFVNTGTGQVYYAFNRNINVAPCPRNPRFPVLVGMDFNVNPMTAVIFQCIDNRIHVLDEIYQMGSRTETMGEYLIKNYGRGLQIIPDSTGTRHTTNSNKSDHEILRDMGFQVVYNKNPARMDRYNCVNNLFEKSRMIIDPRCKYLVKDLEQVSFKDGSSQLDAASDKSLTHISDALGYGVWFCFPIVRPTSGIYSL